MKRGVVDMDGEKSPPASATAAGGDDARGSLERESAIAIQQANRARVADEGRLQRELALGQNPNSTEEENSYGDDDFEQPVAENEGASEDDESY